MQRKLTITIDPVVYDGLQKVVGRGRISGFIEDLVRPHVVANSMDTAYRDMARDEGREQEIVQESIRCRPNKAIEQATKRSDAQTSGG